MRAWIAAFLLFVIIATALWQPPPMQRAEAWVRYRATGFVPPPIVTGRNGRLFLGNHAGSPPNSLIDAVCGNGIDAGVIAKAAAAIRAVLAGSRTTGLPFRFLLVPTAPRIYPEDVPAEIPCQDFAADRLVQILADPAILYPAAAMQALKPQFDVLPRRHFHWAGEGPLRIAELASESLGLPRQLSLTLRPDNRASDLNGFDPGLGLHDRIGTPDLRAAGVSQCAAARCTPAVPDAVVAFTHPGPGRLLLVADSFGDEIGGDFSEVAGQVWLVRMNLALVTPTPPLAAALQSFHPDAVVVLYHDAGALALDPPSQASLALAARLLADAGLPPPPAAP